MGHTNQGVIATLKAYYRRNTFSKAHETHDTLVDFFKDFIVLDAVKNFADAWKEVSERNMRGVWEPLLKRKEAPVKMKVDEIVTEIVNLGAVTDFELTAEDVQESLTFDDTDMSNEDLYEIAPPPRAEANENDEIPSNPDNPGELSYKQLKEILRKGQDFNDFIKNLLLKGIPRSQKTLEKSKALVKQKKSWLNPSKFCQNSVDFFKILVHRVKNSTVESINM